MSFAAAEIAIALREIANRFDEVPETKLLAKHTNGMAELFLRFHEEACSTRPIDRVTLRSLERIFLDVAEKLNDVTSRTDHLRNPIQRARIHQGMGIVSELIGRAIRILDLRLS